MDILENELIKRYFAPEHKAFYPCDDPTSKMDAESWDKCAMGRRVLTAMQEPIKQGERYLMVFMQGNGINEEIAKDSWNTDFHPNALRLPDRFQELIKLASEGK